MVEKLFFCIINITYNMKGFITALLCLTTLYSYATVSDTTHKASDSLHVNNTLPKNLKAGAEGYFKANYNSLDFSKLNTVFNHAGFTMPSTPAISIGGGGEIIIKHWVLGGEGQRLIKQKQTQSFSTSVVNTYYGGGYGMFDLGYTIVSKKRLMLYPMVGIGGGHIYADVIETPSTKDFATNVSAEPVSSHYQNKAFMLQPKLCFDFFAGTFLIGIEGGYNYMLYNNWTINKTKLSNAPSSSLNGLFLGVTVGFGGVR